MTPNLIELIVQAVMNAIETADSDTYINSTREDRIRSALASIPEMPLVDLVEWKSIEAEPPPLDTLVWLFIERTGHVLLGERSTYIEDGETKWSWSEASGIVWNYKGTIAADCEFDDLDPSHWHSLPLLPTTKGAQG